MATSAAKLAVVTGANAGIGLHTALGLARAGMRVVMVGRDPERLEAARGFVAERAAGAETDTALADFSSLDEVRKLAAELLARHERIDVLVNNAGMIASQAGFSADAYEITMAVNHLAPFLLTNLLLDRLRQSAPARVVTVASQAHRGARLDPTMLTWPAVWNPLSAYGRSKLANILFTRALARRLDPAVVAVSCLHPGVIATQIGNNAGIIAGLGWRLAKMFLSGPEKGAENSVFLATVTNPTPFHGAYVIDKRIAEPDTAARDDSLGEALWQESARLVGL
ncbi:MAG TPA: SDR family NAD(P)-dependent oxidoreductase [Stellaceae bacterium]|jgi:retinol dehydrogenase-12|nr:SDR family NAD(P)-dependent oxidoreductase [Stellaceae bacterium]